MSCQYFYQPLTRPRSTRLLRLHPSIDTDEPLQGELIEYHLADINELAHPYEALSYVWGKPEKTRSILIERSDVPITSNLHVALKALRHQSFDRLLWADALCINKEDDVEKYEQIRLMYMIYARASLVIVWLGYERGESGQAIEDLRQIASTGLGRASMNPNDSQACFKRIVKLFKRDWFTRIWVLQEIGAARSIQIRCGRSAIDGYAFGLAVHLLDSAFRARHDLSSMHHTIQSVAYLCQDAIFRSTYSDSAGSEGICPFGELVDMFHGREATRSHDKIYALLNMSSDDEDTSGLLPDYTIPFGELLKRATALILPQSRSIEFRDEMEAVVIKARGHVLGYIEDVDEDTHVNNRQYIDVNWRDTLDVDASDAMDSDVLGHRNIVSWMIQISTTPLQKGDIICVIEGAARPTIIRNYRDFSAILVAAPPPPKFMDHQGVQLTWETVTKQIAAPLRDFLLVWDWKLSPEIFSQLNCYTAWADANKWFSKTSRIDTWTATTEADQILDCGLLWLDAGNLEIAEQRCTEALQAYESALQSKALGSQEGFSNLLRSIRCKFDTIAHTVVTQHVEFQRKLEIQCISWLFSWALQGDFKIAMKILSEIGRVDPNVGGHTQPSMLSLAARMGRLDVVEWLLRQGAHVNKSSFRHSTEVIALHEATEAGHLAIVERLLEANADANAMTRLRGETALQKAAESGNLPIVDCLIEWKACVDAESGWGGTALQKASEAGHMAIVQRLLEAKAIVDGGEFPYEKSPIQTASRNGHLAIVERLLQAGATVNLGKHSEAGTALAAAAKGGHLAVVERLLRAKADVNAEAGLDRDGRTALQAASEAGHLAIVERLLQSKARLTARTSDNETALDLALRMGHFDIVERLKAAAAGSM